MQGLWDGAESLSSLSQTTRKPTGFLFGILPSHVLFLDSLKPLWHLQIGIWGRSGSARHEAFPPHNNRVALEHGTASVKKKRKLYGRITSYLVLYSLAQLLHSSGCVYCAHLPKNWSTSPFATLGLKIPLNWSQIEGKKQKNNSIFQRWTAQPRCGVVRVPVEQK